MNITPLHQDHIPGILDLMELGAPYIRPRTASDYWLYANLFSSTCPIAVEHDHIIGAVIAFRSQDTPDDVYIQDVITHVDHRRKGITTALLTTVRDRAQHLGCRRLYLTSEPDNTKAHNTWTRLGFTNIPGDQVVSGISVITNYKGPGKHRAVYELKIPVPK